MHSLFPAICSSNAIKSKEFYVSLFNFSVIFEIDWYIQLQSAQDENLQIAFVTEGHSSIPYPNLPNAHIIDIPSMRVAWLNHHGALSCALCMSARTRL